MCFEGEVNLITFYNSYVDFFRLQGFMTRCLRLCYRLVHYLLALFSHSIVLACFCFKTNLIHSDRSSFFLIFSNFFSCFVPQVVRSSASPLCKMIELECFKVNLILK